MIRLKEKHAQAIQFRTRGFTYSEIAKIVGVSKSTVSNWVSKKSFSKKIRNENSIRAARENVKRIGLINKSRAIERKARYSEALQSAETEYRHYKKDPRFVAGLVTYLCAGDVPNTSRIRVSSSNPLVHTTFLQFAYEYLGVKKSSVRFWLLLYSDLDEKKCMTTWTRQLKLSGELFYKSQFVQQRAKNKALQHGTGNTIIGNTVLKKKLVRWIELFSKDQ